MKRKLILASTSPFRRALLQNAGLNFSWEGPGIDERTLEQREQLIDAEEVAVSLACAKALAVSAHKPEALVIGCDQTMSLEGRLFHKPENIGGARAQLLALRGKCHQLSSGVVLACGGEVIWTYVGIARLTMRRFSNGFLTHYLDKAGEKVCQSVGGYQLEAEGIQLFSEVDGDYFTILGLPLIPLLNQLREMGEVDA